MDFGAKGRFGRRRKSAETGDGNAAPVSGGTDRAVIPDVRRALDALPPLERDAIELVLYGGHGYRQVAVLLGVAEGTVNSSIRSGLRRLQAILTDNGSDGGA